MSEYVIREVWGDEVYYYDDGWKSYVCQDFDDNVVILGGRDYESIEEATWWDDARELLNDAEDTCWHSAEGEELDDFISNNKDSYAEDKLHDIWDIYQETRDAEDTDTIIKAANVLYPIFNIRSRRLNGYHDSVCAVYNAAVVDPDILEDWFFGNVVDISLFEKVEPENPEDEEDSDWISETYDWGNEIDRIALSQTEYYKVSHGRDNSGYIKLFDLPADSTITVLEEDY